MVTRYVPVALPARIDLNSPETGKQLLFGVGIKSPSDRPHNRNCSDASYSIPDPSAVIHESISKFIDSQHSSLDAQEALFEKFLRFFHSEYDDVWYSRNRERLARSFKPLWDEFMDSTNGLSRGFTDAVVSGPWNDHRAVNLLD